jgi:hypothetical protein
MKTRNLATRLVIAALLVVIPATAAWATTRQDAEAAIAEAKTMRDRAAAAGVAKSEAGSMIEEAESLLKVRQYTKAKMIAYWAIRQDEFAIDALGGETPAEQNKEALANAMIKSAEAAREKAASVGGEWRDVGDMLKSAKTLAGAGDFDKAMEVASAAKFQAEKGYEQAMAEKNADFPVYMHKAVGK